MENEVNMERAREVYDELCEMLDTREWSYDKDEERLIIKSGIKGKDLPINFILIVNPKSQVVQFLSSMPFAIPEDKRIDCAVAVCVANYGLVDGSFDYDITDGEIRYRVTSSYRDSRLGPDLYEYLIMVGASTVDNYNDKFFALSKGYTTIQEFIDNDRS